MSEFTTGNVPGSQTKVEAEESQVTWAGRYGQDLVATRRVTLDAAATDPGNSPTTTLRGGNVLALVDASGKAHTYDPDANDGRQMAVGILEHYQNMLVDGAIADRFTQILVHGLVKESELVGLDPRARQQLGARFIFDKDFGASLGVLMHPRGIYRKSANYVVTAADNGLLFLATAAVAFTLPAKQNGLAFRFFQTADFDLTIAGSADIIHKGNAAASSVAFQTAGQKIGSHALVECLYTADSVLKWVVSNLGGTTATVA
ncbi:MAG TPA: head decoration protein [Pirellulaceae bacterium]|nr:head decoration protein [Pirellulaceae bacterium]